MRKRKKQSGAKVRADILEVCRDRFQTAKQIAEALGMPVNSVRAYYVYKMARGGELETKMVSGREADSAKPGTRGWTKTYRARKTKANK
jgi:predicted ArsR family transcriptional regulator